MRRLITALLAMTFVLTAGCSAADGEINSAQAERVETMVSIVADEVPLGEISQKLYIPTSPKIRVYSNNKVEVDASNSNDGYIAVTYSGSNPKIKVQITRSGGTTYTYDLNARNTFEVFPFTEGNGSYTIKVYENVSGTSYAQAFSQTIDVALKNEFSPFLYANQYVNFRADSQVVQLASQLVGGMTDELQIVDTVYNYVVNNLTYDYVKANTVQSGYLPDPDKILAVKTGICFDYAAVMSAMLRSQGIPTKLVVGYTGNQYHAWIDVYVKEVGWVASAIYFDGQNWNLMDPTFASTGQSSQSVISYITNPANYSAKYAY